MARDPPAELPIPPPTAPLLLAEKWAHHRHDATSRGGAVFGQGDVEPVLQIYHGSAPIVVRDLGKCLMVLGAFEFAPETRARLNEASPGERGMFFSELEEILMSCPRIGYSLGPHGVTDARDVRQVVLDQTLQISENDPSSFNRFSDAIQETETVLLRASGFVKEFSQTVIGEPRYSSRTPAPSELYL